MRLRTLCCLSFVMLSCGGCLGAGGARGSKATRAEIAGNGVWYALHAERLTPSLEVMLRAASDAVSYGGAANEASDAFPVAAETPTALYGSQWMSERIFVLLPASDAGPETFRLNIEGPEAAALVLSRLADESPPDWQRTMPFGFAVSLMATKPREQTPIVDIHAAVSDAVEKLRTARVCIAQDPACVMRADPDPLLAALQEIRLSSYGAEMGGKNPALSSQVFFTALESFIPEASQALRGRRCEAEIRAFLAQSHNLLCGFLRQNHSMASVSRKGWQTLQVILVGMKRSNEALLQLSNQDTIALHTCIGYEAAADAYDLEWDAM